eukprot:1420939-Prymnesium_polylepis.2
MTAVSSRTFPASGPWATCAAAHSARARSCASATSGGVWQDMGMSVYSPSVCASPTAGPIVIVPSTRRTIFACVC